jgi:hypothetical protein
MLNAVTLTSRDLRRWMAGFDAADRQRTSRRFSRQWAIELGLSMIEAGRSSGAGADAFRERQTDQVRKAWAKLRSRWS